jgi:hypothetical protein
LDSALRFGAVLIGENQTVFGAGQRAGHNGDGEQSALTKRATSHAVILTHFAR